MVWVADEFLPRRVDHEIEKLQGNLADEYGTFTRNFRHPDNTIAILDRQPYRLEDSKLGDAGRGVTASASAQPKAALRHCRPKRRLRRVPVPARAAGRRCLPSESPEGS